MTKPTYLITKRTECPVCRGCGRRNKEWAETWKNLLPQPNIEEYAKNLGVKWWDYQDPCDTCGEVGYTDTLVELPEVIRSLFKEDEEYD